MNQIGEPDDLNVLSTIRLFSGICYCSNANVVDNCIPCASLIQNGELVHLNLLPIEMAIQWYKLCCNF